MTAIKAADVDRFVARPDPGQPIVLVYGPDAGLVRERVAAMVKASVDDNNDPFAFVRLEGEEPSQHAHPRSAALARAPPLGTHPYDGRGLHRRRRRVA